MNNKRFGIFCTLITFIVSVAFAQTRVFIPEPYGDSFIESELIDMVSYTPLQVERYGTIMPDMEMRVDDENYFILDNRKTQCVFRFNLDGELLNTICEKKKQTSANDPDLSNPVKFNIDPYRNMVELYNFENSSITRFSYDGSAKSSIAFQFNPSDFARDNNGQYWIYTGWKNSETPFRLLKTDNNGKITDKLMRLTTNCTPTEGYAFQHRKDDLLFWELLGNTVYSIKNDKVEPTYQLDYGNYMLPLDYHYIESDESFKKINQAGYYSVKKYLENDNFAYFFLNFTNIDKRDMFHIIIDKKTSQTHIYSEDAGISAFDKAQALTDNNELVFLVAPRRMRQLMNNETDYVPVVFEGLIDELSKLRNPIILKIKLRSPSDYQNNNNNYEEQNYFND
jgi:hypothetical protein